MNRLPLFLLIASALLARGCACIATGARNVIR